MDRVNTSGLLLRYKVCISNRCYKTTADNHRQLSASSILVLAINTQADVTCIFHMYMYVHT
jgi:hypothetical protein